MQVFLVKTSVGEYEDRYETIDSVWSNQQDALARVKILEDNNDKEIQFRNFCLNCPSRYEQSSSETKHEYLSRIRNYCAQYCDSKGHPYFDAEYNEVECNESSEHYESVTVYSPEAVDLDNTELLNHESSNSN